jgi:hypothetical protein
MLTPHPSPKLALASTVDFTVPIYFLPVAHLWLVGLLVAGNVGTQNAASRLEFGTQIFVQRVRVLRQICDAHRGVVGGAFGA